MGAKGSKPFKHGKRKKGKKTKTPKEDTPVMADAGQKAPEAKVDETDGGFGPWENIVEKSMVGTGIMTDGAIIDRDGKIYGINDKFTLKKQQIKTLVQALYDDIDQTTIPTEGIVVGDRTFKYVLREIGDKMIGKDGESGIIIRCSRKFIIIGIYNGIEKKQMAEEMMVDLQRYFVKQDI